jgi:hypothetical protein
VAELPTDGLGLKFHLYRLIFELFPGQFLFWGLPRLFNFFSQSFFTIPLSPSPARHIIGPSGITRMILGADA